MKTVYLTICFMPITMKNGNSKLYMLKDLLLSLNLHLSEIIKKKRYLWVYRERKIFNIILISRNKQKNSKEQTSLITCKWLSKRQAIS